MIEYTQTELRLMAVSSALGAAFTFLIGGVDKLITALLIFITIDYVTGLVAAWYTGMLHSKKGFDGIKRKISMLIIVIIAHWIDVSIIGSGTLRSMVIFAYLGNEALSIIENLDRLGCEKYIPVFLRTKLLQLREEKQTSKDS